MIIISILSRLLSNAIKLRWDLSILFNRIAIITLTLTLILCILQDIVSLSILNNGIGLHGGLLHIINIMLIYFISILMLQLTSFYPFVLIRPLFLFKYFLFKDWFYLSLSFLNKYYDKYIYHFINMFNYEGYYFNEIDSILSLLVIYINIYIKNINCLIPFSFSFLIFLLYKAEVLNMLNITPYWAIDLIYLNLSLLFFSIGFMINLVRLIVKWIFFNELKKNYPLSFNIIKYILFSLLFFNIIIIIIIGQKILFKGNIINKLKDWKLNIDYEIRKGNKWPKKPENFNIFFSKKNQGKT